MKLEPQKASTKKKQAAPEERQHQTEQDWSELHLELEPAWPGKEDDVRERRVASEFTVSLSQAALDHMAGRSADFMREVRRKACQCAYAAERQLCGVIIRIGNVPEIDEFDRWWAPFCVEDLWFRVEYHDTYIRQYEVMPAVGPAPDSGGGGPPPMRRQQLRPPPKRIGPRPRVRRDRGDVKGVRAQKPPPAKNKKKRGDVERVLTELYNLRRWEVEQAAAEFAHKLLQLWRARKPRLLRSLASMRRFVAVCGSALRDHRDVVASFVQTLPVFAAFGDPASKALTGQRERAAETFGPRGRLEPNNAGHAISAWLKLYSWKWEEPPVPWAEYLFGVDWTLNIFGAPEEEQVFT